MSYLIEAIKAGIAMRQAQVQYFKTRTKEALIASKQAEKEFDALAAAAMSKAEDQIMKTHKLFDLPLGSRFRYLLDRESVYVLIDRTGCGKVASARRGPDSDPSQGVFMATTTREEFQSVMVEFVPVQEVPCAD